MKAAVYHGAGDVRIEDVPLPGAPPPGQVTLQMQMGALCGTDASQFMSNTLIPLQRRHPASGHQGPVILGHELVGQVLALGAGVDQLALGQRVVPGASSWCGDCLACQGGRVNLCERYFVYGLHAHGGLAEFANFPAKMCVPVPNHCSTPAAALAQTCAVALHALRQSELTAGQTVALFGAGGIGSLLLALLAVLNMQATILATDIDPLRLRQARALGATTLIDARSEHTVEAMRAATGGRGVDLAIEASGVPELVAQALAVVGRGGTLLQVGIPQQPVLLPLAQAVLEEKRLVTTNGQVTPVDLPQALRLLADTDLAERIDSCIIPLAALVEEGLRPLAEHRAGAKILVEIGSSAAAWRGKRCGAPSELPGSL